MTGLERDGRSERELRDVARSDDPMLVKRWLTIPEVVDVTGLTKRAVQARIERGTLPSELHAGRRVVALPTLYELGLIPLSPGRTVSELLDRLEEAQRRIGELEAELRRRREEAGEAP